jgi:hypothetical protein
MKTFTFRGEVVEKGTKLPPSLPGNESIRVELVDLQQRVDEPLLVTLIDAQGEFSMSIDEARIERAFGKGEAMGYFRLLRTLNNAVVGTTERTRRWDLRSNSSGRIEVDTTRPLATLTNPLHSVEGVVLNSAGPVAGALVTVTRRTFIAGSGTMGSTTVGEVTTDAAGRFRLAVNSTVTSPFLDITATFSSTSGTATVPNASPREFVRVVLGEATDTPAPAPTTISRVVAAIREATAVSINLAAANPAVAAFTANVAPFVATRSGVGERDLAAFVDATKLQQTPIGTTIDLHALYAFTSAGVAPTRDAVFTHRVPTLRRMIDRAEQARTIPKFSTTARTAVDAAIKAQALLAIRVAPAGGVYRAGNIIDAITHPTPNEITTAHRDTFLNALLDHDGPNETFWDSTALSSLTSNAKLRFRLGFEAANICNWHQPLVAAVITEINNGTLSAAEQLASKTVAQWVTLQGASVPPAGTPGANDAERRTNFATLVESQAALRFRTQHIKSRVAVGSLEKAFFDAHPTFDFDKTRFSLFSQGLSLSAPTRARMADLDRVFRVTESWTEMNALLNAGLTSAKAIQKTGKDGTKQALINGGMTVDAAEAAATKAFKKTCWVVNASAAMGASYKVASKITTPSWKVEHVSASSLDPKIADWPSLFGSVDQCECTHCTSALSPSAYLVDVLETLETVPASGGSNARLALQNRRPDIARLALSCENTDTPIPYVDLVNEILEYRLSTSWPTPPPQIQTKGEAADLAAHPDLLYPLEHVQAYTTLNSAVFPLQAPFNLWQEEARIYLDHLGVPRDRLLETFAPAAGPDSRDLAIERLRISATRFDLLRTTGNPPNPHDFWGLPSANFQAEVAKVSVFMKQTGFSFEQVRELTTAFSGLSITPTDSCNPAMMTLTGFATSPHTLNRFLRLRDTLGLSVSDTGRVWKALGSTLDPTTLPQFAALRTLWIRLDADPVVVASWFADVDRNDLWNASMFTRTFLSPSTYAPTLEPFRQLYPDGGVTTSTYSAASAGLLAALRIPATDLALLIDEDAAQRELGVSALVNGASAMTVAGLSLLFRTVTFAAATGLSVRELLTFARLTDTSAAGVGIIEGLRRPAKPIDTLRFLDLLERTRRVGLSAPVADYVLRHVATQESGLEPSEDVVAGWEKSLLGVIAEAAEETRQLVDDQPSAQSAFWTIGSQVLHFKDTGFSELHTLDQIVRGLVTGPTASTYFNDRVPVFGDRTHVIARIAEPTDPAYIQSEDERRTFVTRRLARFLKVRAALVERLSELMELPADVVATLWARIDNSADPTTYVGTLGAVFATRWIPVGFDDTYGTLDPSPTASADRRADLILLHQAAHSLRARAVSAAEVEPGVMALSLSQLPLTRKTGPVVSTDFVATDFENLILDHELAWIRDRWGRTDDGGPVAFFDYTNSGITVDAGLTRLAERNGFIKADVVTLMNRFAGSGTATLVDLRSVRRMARLFLGIEALRAMGASAAQAIAWCTVVSTPPQLTPTFILESNALAQAREIKSLARSKYDEATWATIGKAIRDPLRERQRQLLTATLVGQLGLQSSDELFDRMLIDVEMSPCALTSRLVSAHAAVQTFVQRIQLNLETNATLGPTIAPSKLLSRRWDWMFAYRVWEANRKVFLWPENWIEPELRPDKTPLFEQLESSLRKAAIDDETVTDAYREYLEGLSEIANLDIMAMCRDGDTLHLFGRTPAPHRYFHRTYRSGVFTPWRHVDLDIEGEHVVAVVAGGTLHLFWMTLEDRPTTESQESLKQAVETEVQELETVVRIYCAELRRGGWRTVTGNPRGQGLGELFKPELLYVTAEPSLTGIELRLMRHNGAYPERIAKFVQSASSRAYLPVELGGPTESADPLTYLEFYQRLLARPALPLPEPAFPEDVVANGEMVLIADVPWYVATTAEHEPAPDYEFFSTGNETRSYLFVATVTPGYTIAAIPYSTQFNTETAQIQQAIPVSFGPKITGFTPLALHHPFAPEFRRRLALGGLDRLLSLRDTPDAQPTQTLSAPVSMTVGAKVKPIPADTVDFTAGSAFGEYNWELFFHAPFLIANRLSQEGKFADARRWYHAIFDPTDGAAVPSTSASTRYWKFLPFAENKNLADIQSELNSLAASQYAKDILGWSTGANTTNLVNQIQLWRDGPFNPHAIARLRVVAYQKAVVMRYIDNLIAWGDALFRQDTMESVNEATQLYVLAHRLLGPKPTLVGRAVPKPLKTYSDLGSIDPFGNALDIESIVPPPPPTYTSDFNDAKCEAEPEIGSVIGSLEFCIPENEKLLGYWDIVADRLFKIRHCQNIEGIVRQLPLFQPPIDPALLVRARAAGLDLRSVVFDLQVSGPPYRYAILAARAMDYANAVAGLGASLLSALEKVDGEELAQMRAGHEVANLSWTRGIRKQQRDEARNQRDAAQQALALAKGRLDFYSSREFVNEEEDLALKKASEAESDFMFAASLRDMAGLLRVIPEVATGAVSAFAMAGGQAAANVLELGAQVYEAGADALTRQAGQLSTVGGYNRRMDDWKFQAEQAEVEIKQLDKQLLAAEIRLAIAEHELTLLEQQLEQSKEVERFLRSKFTDKDLYSWMARELTVAFGESFRIAYEMARHAERAFQRERGDTSQVFVRFDSWDGTRKGLLAGEKLASDLRRMDAAYHTQNTREHEITKTVSLSQLDPEAFLKLREGSTEPCEFSLPESMFDEDFPTHYLRRIKAVSVTLQCNPGPYQSVYGALELKSAGIRPKPTGIDQLDAGPAARMVTSAAVNDTGLFEFNFRDERYLPFEYRGVQAFGNNKQWGFTLSKGNEFDYDSISDLVLQLRYTAREGRTSPATSSPSRQVLLRISETHADRWAAFKEGSAGTIVIPTTKASFPKPRGRTLGDVTNVTVFARHTTAPMINVNPPSTTAILGTAIAGTTVYKAVFTGIVDPNVSRDWTITVPNTITDLWLAFTYNLT